MICEHPGRSGYPEDCPLQKGEQRQQMVSPACGFAAKASGKSSCRCLGIWPTTSCSSLSRARSVPGGARPQACFSVGCSGVPQASAVALPAFRSSLWVCREPEGTLTLCCQRGAPRKAWLAWAFLCQFTSGEGDRACQRPPESPSSLADAPGLRGLLPDVVGKQADTLRGRGVTEGDGSGSVACAHVTSSPSAVL